MIPYRIFLLIFIFAVSLVWISYEMSVFIAKDKSTRSHFQPVLLPVQRHLTTTLPSLTPSSPSTLHPTPPLTSSPTSDTSSPSPILKTHIQLFRLLNPQDYLVDIAPPALTDLLAYKQNAIRNYVFTHFPSESLPNTSTPLPALPFYLKSYNTYQYNPDSNLVELKPNRSLPLPTATLDSMLSNETRCMSSLRLSMLNHNIQLLRGMYKLLASPCAPCLITLRHTSRDNTLFSYLKANNYPHVFGKGYRAHFGAINDHFMFVKAGLSRCDNIKSLFDII
jgi:hypothetical protein